MAQLVRAWQRARGAVLRVELHVTPDVVTNPPNLWCDALVNPANERLQGARFIPSEAARKLAPNTGIIYPEQTVDGRVDELGGVQLRRLCRELPELEPGGVRCPVGHTVCTAATGALRRAFGAVLHTVPPIYQGSHANISRSDEWEKALQSCFATALDEAASLSRRAYSLPQGLSDGDATPRHSHHLMSMAVPLLGAGARGAPYACVARVAATTVTQWEPSDTAHRHQQGISTETERKTEIETETETGTETETETTGKGWRPQILVCFTAIDDEQAEAIEGAMAFVGESWQD